MIRQFLLNSQISSLRRVTRSVSYSFIKKFAAFIEQIIKLTEVSRMSGERFSWIFLLERFRQKMLSRIDKAGNSGFLYAYLSSLLHEPQSKVEQILAHNAAHNALVGRRREQRRRLRDIVQYRQAFVWDDCEKLLEFQRQNRQSRIIAMFHFGDFVNALSCLTAVSEQNRQRILIRHRGFELMPAINRRIELEDLQIPEARQMHSQQLELLSLVAELRKGNTTLTVFCDLPRGFGDVVKVNFLGGSAWFPRGPATLAVLAKIPVLPFITYRDAGVNCISMPGVIEAKPRSNECFADAVGRVTQAAVDVLEKQLLRFPAQWLYLKQLPTYFVYD